MNSAELPSDRPPIISSMLNQASIKEVHANENKLLHSIHLCGLNKLSIYNKSRNNVIKYYYPESIPAWIQFDKDNFKIDIHLSFEKLRQLPEKKGIIPYESGQMIRPGSEKFFGSSCMTVESFESKRQRGVYPERFLRMLNKTVPNSFTELETIIKEIKKLPSEIEPQTMTFNKISSMVTMVNDEKLQMAAHYLHQHYLISRLRSYYLTHNNPTQAQKEIMDLLKDNNCSFGEDIMDFVLHMGNDLPHQCDIDYMPISEVLSTMPFEDLREIMKRSSGKPSDEESRLMDRLCQRCSILSSHGIEKEKGGLKNLINIMLEGEFRKSGQMCFGPLGTLEYRPTNECTSLHGPFYIVAAYDNISRNHSITAYLVPLDSDLDLVTKVIEKAFELDLIQKEEKQDLLTRIFTFEQYINLSQVKETPT